MRCRARIHHKKGKQDIIVPYFATVAPSSITEALCGGMGDDFTICDGEVVVTVEAVEEPYFGGCLPTLEISYRCKKCNNDTFPELPSKYTLGDFMTQLLKDMPKVERDRLVASYWESQTKGWRS